VTRTVCPSVIEHPDSLFISIIWRKKIISGRAITSFFAYSMGQSIQVGVYVVPKL
jgi:hypothetical protein